MSENKHICPKCGTDTESPTYWERNERLAREVYEIRNDAKDLLLAVVEASRDRILNVDSKFVNSCVEMAAHLRAECVRTVVEAEKKRRDLPGA